MLKMLHWNNNMYSFVRRLSLMLLLGNLEGVLGGATSPFDPECFQARCLNPAAFSSPLTRGSSSGAVAFPSSTSSEPSTTGHSDTDFPEASHYRDCFDSVNSAGSAGGSSLMIKVTAALKESCCPVMRELGFCFVTECLIGNRTTQYVLPSMRYQSQEYGIGLLYDSASPVRDLMLPRGTGHTTGTHDAASLFANVSSRSKASGAETEPPDGGGQETGGDQQQEPFPRHRHRTLTTTNNNADKEYLRFDPLATEWACGFNLGNLNEHSRIAFSLQFNTDADGGAASEEAVRSKLASSWANELRSALMSYQQQNANASPPENSPPVYDSTTVKSFADFFPSDMQFGTSLQWTLRSIDSTDPGKVNSWVIDNEVNFTRNAYEQWHRAAYPLAKKITDLLNAACKSPSSDPEQQDMSSSCPLFSAISSAIGGVSGAISLVVTWTSSTASSSTSSASIRLHRSLLASEGEPLPSCESDVCMNSLPSPEKQQERTTHTGFGPFQRGSGPADYQPGTQSFESCFVTARKNVGDPKNVQGVVPDDPELEVSDFYSCCQWDEQADPFVANAFSTSGSRGSKLREFQVCRSEICGLDMNREAAKSRIVDRTEFIAWVAEKSNGTRWYNMSDGSAYDKHARAIDRDCHVNETEIEDEGYLHLQFSLLFVRRCASSNRDCSILTELKPEEDRVLQEAAIRGLRNGLKDFRRLQFGNLPSLDASIDNAEIQIRDTVLTSTEWVMVQQGDAPTGGAAPAQEEEREGKRVKFTVGLWFDEWSTLEMLTRAYTTHGTGGIDEMKWDMTTPERNTFYLNAMQGVFNAASTGTTGDKNDQDNNADSHDVMNPVHELNFEYHHQARHESDPKNQGAGSLTSESVRQRRFLYESESDKCLMRHCSAFVGGSAAVSGTTVLDDEPDMMDRLRDAGFRRNLLSLLEPHNFANEKTFGGPSGGTTGGEGQSSAALTGNKDSAVSELNKIRFDQTGCFEKDDYQNTIRIESECCPGWQALAYCIEQHCADSYEVQKSGYGGSVDGKSPPIFVDWSNTVRPAVQQQCGLDTTVAHNKMKSASTPTAFTGSATTSSGEQQHDPQARVWLGFREQYYWGTDNPPYPSGDPGDYFRIDFLKLYRDELRLEHGVSFPDLYIRELDAHVPKAPGRRCDPQTGYGVAEPHEGDQQRGDLCRPGEAGTGEADMSEDFRRRLKDRVVEARDISAPSSKLRRHQKRRHQMKARRSLPTVTFSAKRKNIRKALVSFVQQSPEQRKLGTATTGEGHPGDYACPSNCVAVDEAPWCVNAYDFPCRFTEPPITPDGAATGKGKPYDVLFDIEYVLGPFEDDAAANRTISASRVPNLATTGLPLPKARTIQGWRTNSMWQFSPSGSRLEAAFRLREVAAYKPTRFEQHCVLNATNFVGTSFAENLRGGASTQESVKGPLEFYHNDCWSEVTAIDQEDGAEERMRFEAKCCPAVTHFGTCQAELPMSDRLAVWQKEAIEHSCHYSLDHKRLKARFKGGDIRVHIMEPFSAEDAANSNTDFQVAIHEALIDTLRSSSELMGGQMWNAGTVGSACGNPQQGSAAGGGEGVKAVNVTSLLTLSRPCPSCMVELYLNYTLESLHPDATQTFRTFNQRYAGIGKKEYSTWWLNDMKARLTDHPRMAEYRGMVDTLQVPEEYVMPEANSAGGMTVGRYWTVQTEITDLLSTPSSRCFYAHCEGVLRDVAMPRMPVSTFDAGSAWRYRVWENCVHMRDSWDDRDPQGTHRMSFNFQPQCCEFVSPIVSCLREHCPHYKDDDPRYRLFAESGRERRIEFPPPRQAEHHHESSSSQEQNSRSLQQVEESSSPSPPPGDASSSSSSSPAPPSGTTNIFIVRMISNPFFSVPDHLAHVEQSCGLNLASGIAESRFWLAGEQVLELDQRGWMVGAFGNAQRDPYALEPNSIYPMGLNESNRTGSLASRIPDASPGEDVESDRFYRFFLHRWMEQTLQNAGVVEDFAPSPILKDKMNILYEDADIAAPVQVVIPFPFAAAHGNTTSKTTAAAAPFEIRNTSLMDESWLHMSREYARQMSQSSGSQDQMPPASWWSPYEQRTDVYFNLSIPFRIGPFASAQAAQEFQSSTLLQRLPQFGSFGFVGSKSGTIPSSQGQDEGVNSAGPDKRRRRRSLSSSTSSHTSTSFNNLFRLHWRNAFMLNLRFISEKAPERLSCGARHCVSEQSEAVLAYHRFAHIPLQDYRQCFSGDERDLAAGRSQYAATANSDPKLSFDPSCCERHRIPYVAQCVAHRCLRSGDSADHAFIEQKAIEVSCTAPPVNPFQDLEGPVKIALTATFQLEEEEQAGSSGLTEDFIKTFLMPQGQAETAARRTVLATLEEYHPELVVLDGDSATSTASAISSTAQRFISGDASTQLFTRFVVAEDKNEEYDPYAYSSPSPSPSSTTTNKALNITLYAELRNYWGPGYSYHLSPRRVRPRFEEALQNHLGSAIQLLSQGKVLLSQHSSPSTGGASASTSSGESQSASTFRFFSMPDGDGLRLPGRSESFMQCFMRSCDTTTRYRELSAPHGYDLGSCMNPDPEAFNTETCCPVFKRLGGCALSRCASVDPMQFEQVLAASRQICSFSASSDPKTGLVTKYEIRARVQIQYDTSSSTTSTSSSSAEASSSPSPSSPGIIPESSLPGGQNWWWRKAEMQSSTSSSPPTSAQEHSPSPQEITGRYHDFTESLGKHFFSYLQAKVAERTRGMTMTQSDSTKRTRRTESTSRRSSAADPQNNRLLSSTTPGSLLPSDRNVTIRRVQLYDRPANVFAVSGTSSQSSPEPAESPAPEPAESPSPEPAESPSPEPAESPSPDQAESPSPSTNTYSSTPGSSQQHHVNLTVSFSFGLFDSHESASAFLSATEGGWSALFPDFLNSGIGRLSTTKDGNLPENPFAHRVNGLELFELTQQTMRGLSTSDINVAEISVMASLAEDGGAVGVNNAEMTTDESPSPPPDKSSSSPSPSKPLSDLPLLSSSTSSTTTSSTTTQEPRDAFEVCGKLEFPQSLQLLHVSLTEAEVGCKSPDYFPDYHVLTKGTNMNAVEVLLCDATTRRWHLSPSSSSPTSSSANEGVVSSTSSISPSTSSSSSSSTFLDLAEIGGRCRTARPCGASSMSQLRGFGTPVCAGTSVTADTVVMPGSVCTTTCAHDHTPVVVSSNGVSSSSLSSSSLSSATTATGSLICEDGYFHLVHQDATSSASISANSASSDSGSRLIGCTPKPASSAVTSSTDSKAVQNGSGPSADIDTSTTPSTGTASRPQSQPLFENISVLSGKLTLLVAMEAFFAILLQEFGETASPSPPSSEADYLSFFQTHVQHSPLFREIIAGSLGADGPSMTDTVVIHESHFVSQQDYHDSMSDHLQTMSTRRVLSSSSTSRELSSTSTSTTKQLELTFEYRARGDDAGQRVLNIRNDMIQTSATVKAERFRTSFDSVLFEKNSNSGTGSGTGSGAQQETGRTTSDILLDFQVPLQHVQVRNAVFSVSNKWIPLVWSPCTAGCGSGVHERQLVCPDVVFQLGDYCPQTPDMMSMKTMQMSSTSSSSAALLLETETCKSYSGCGFQECPLRAEDILPCADQAVALRSSVLGILALLIGFNVIYFYRGCRRPRKGRQQITDAGRIAWKTVLDEKTGKLRVIWDVANAKKELDNYTAEQSSSGTKGKVLDEDDDQATDAKVKKVKPLDKIDEDHVADFRQEADGELKQVVVDVEGPRQDEISVKKEKLPSPTEKVSEISTTDSRLLDGAEQLPLEGFLQLAKIDPPPREYFASGARLEYFSQRFSAWIPCQMSAWNRSTNTCSIIIQARQQKPNIDFLRLRPQLQPGELCQVLVEVSTPFRSASWVGPCRVVKALNGFRGYLVSPARKRRSYSEEEDFSASAVLLTNREDEDEHRHQHVLDGEEVPAKRKSGVSFATAPAELKSKDPTATFPASPDEENTRINPANEKNGGTFRVDLGRIRRLIRKGDEVLILEQQQRWRHAKVLRGMRKVMPATEEEIQSTLNAQSAGGGGASSSAASSSGAPFSARGRSGSLPLYRAGYPDSDGDATPRAALMDRGRAGSLDFLGGSSATSTKVGMDHNIKGGIDLTTTTGFDELKRIFGTPLRKMTGGSSLPPDSTDSTPRAASTVGERTPRWMSSSTTVGGIGNQASEDSLLGRVPRGGSSGGGPQFLLPSQYTVLSYFPKVQHKGAVAAAPEAAESTPAPQQQGPQVVSSSSSSRSRLPSKQSTATSTLDFSSAEEQDHQPAAPPLLDGMTISVDYLDHVEQQVTVNSQNPKLHLPTDICLSSCVVLPRRGVEGK